MSLTGKRGRQGRDRANLLAPVNRYLSKLSTHICPKNPSTGVCQNCQHVVVQKNPSIGICQIYQHIFVQKNSSTGICQNNQHVFVQRNPSIDICQNYQHVFVQNNLSTGFCQQYIYSAKKLHINCLFLLKILRWIFFYKPKY